MPYLLDTNIFIQSKNLYYGMDFCPAFWDWLVKSNRKGVLFSIEKVKNELQSIKDDLSKWAEQQHTDFFLKPNESVLKSLSIVSEKVNNMSYEPVAKNAFFQSADYYLIAQAQTANYIVVTHEIPSDSKRKIKIPDICIKLGIKFMTVYEMLRAEQVRFILKT